VYLLEWSKFSQESLTGPLKHAWRLTAAHSPHELPKSAFTEGFHHLLHLQETFEEPIDVRYLHT
jgi:hypothetical protein